ncbi:hypothetical protein [Actinomadura sp. NEAU-AAG7]|uniref:hypothetical protein n=1 Tax=Actinomadura sp. NEAU-AAG7 TaxID=2839640 RepID=UPI001BE3E58B|nr:hypothetical protein [Actinomadura sp. NEAU-AAG7]MBT2209247.1 hypothetical protein [Actinomadura sp. NEAU-AAG7]
MTQEETRPGPGERADEKAVAQEREPEDGFDTSWIPPALLFLAAKGARAIDDEGFWGWTAMGLGLLAAAVSVAVIVRAVHRRAYETLITGVVGVAFMAAVAYAKHDLL